MVFFRAAMRRVWFLSSYDFNIREPLVWHQGSPVSIRIARGIAALLLSHGRGIRPQDTLKGEFRGLSQGVAGNPGFPGPVTVTSGSFSGCLLEVRNTVEFGGALGTPLGMVEGRGPHLELRREPQRFSPVLTWVSACVSHFKQEVRSRRVWRHGTLLSSRVVNGVSGLQWSDFGPGDLFGLATGTSELPPCFQWILG